MSFPDTWHVTSLAVCLFYLPLCSLLSITFCVVYSILGASLDCDNCCSWRTYIVAGSYSLNDILEV